MMDTDSITDALTHPLTALSVVASAVVATVPALGPVWEFVGSTAGTWFPLVAVSAGRILPEVGLESIGSKVLLGAAIVYVTVYLDRLIDAIQTRL